MNKLTPTSLLVEPGAPQWAKRLGLRLDQTYQSLYPQQPTRLWEVDSPADLPPAADWPGSVVSVGGIVFVSDGATWTAVGPAAPQSTVPIPPQFDNSDLIANTAWVTRFGKQYASYTQMLTAAFAITAAHIGGLVQYAGAGGIAVAATLPPVAGLPTGATVTIWAGGGKGTLHAAGSDLIYEGISPGQASFPVVAGDVAELMVFGGLGWIIVSGSLHEWPTPPQFDNDASLATTGWVNRVGHQYSGDTFLGASGTLTAAVAGGWVILNANNIVATLPLSSTMPRDTTITLIGALGGTVQSQASEPIYVPGVALTSVPLGLGDTLEVVSFAGGGWEVTGGSALLKYSHVLGGQTGNPSYQRFPSGLIMQTGWNQILSGGSVVINLPVTLSNSMNAMATPYAGTTPGKLWCSVTTTQLTVSTDVTPQNFSWLVFGN